MTTGVRITGATRLYAIVGDPIAQAKSPEVFSARFAAAGIDAVMVPVHVPAARFDSIVPALMEIANLDGLLATVPFKARMTAFATRVGATVECIGALNALRREADGSWTGEMFDGAGFVRAAKRKQQRVLSRRVALFGAGGAGSAIACALAEAGVRSIHVIDVDASRAQALVARLSRAFASCAFEVASTPPHDVDMVVNASPVGMRREDGLPGPIGELTAGTLVGDVVIVDEPTALIRDATRCGCHFVDGRDMHAGQVDAIVDFFAQSARPHA